MKTNQKRFSLIAFFSSPESRVTIYFKCKFLHDVTLLPFLRTITELNIKVG